ncbi:MAG: PaaI family thioesterase [Acidimicrobiales bacterium]
MGPGSVDVGRGSGETAGRRTLTGEEQAARRQAMPALFLGTPYLATLGLVVERYDPDDVEIRLPFRHDLSNDGRTYHGGVVATMLDSAGALAAWSNHDFDRGVRAATVSMSVQYLATADRTDLRCRGVTIRRARELVFTQMTATDPKGRILAQGIQTYRIG